MKKYFVTVGIFSVMIALVFFAYCYGYERGAKIQKSVNELQWVIYNDEERYRIVISEETIDGCKNMSASVKPIIENCLQELHSYHSSDDNLQNAISIGEKWLNNFESSKIHYEPISKFLVVCQRTNENRLMVDDLLDKVQAKNIQKHHNSEFFIVFFECKMSCEDIGSIYHTQKSCGLFYLNPCKGAKSY